MIGFAAGKEPSFFWVLAKALPVEPSFLGPYARGGSLHLFREHAFQMASRKHDAPSFHERHLRAAVSF